METRQSQVTGTNLQNADRLNAYYDKSLLYLEVIEQSTLAPAEPAFSHFFDFPFDPFQLEAMHHIRRGHSVMVAAPTSSGKTVVAEYALWRALQNGTRAIYTTPIKALSNQKRRDLELLFPGQVGLLTGDRSERGDAPIVVMTTEVLRNMLVEDPESLLWVTTVIFDEIHYLADPERGTVWEESIITCPPQIQLVCLSATIANAPEIADWIQQTHGDISLVRHDRRPVPLEHYYFSDGHLQVVRDAHGARRAMFLRERRGPPSHPADVVRALAQADMLPAIWFAFARQLVENAAAACVEGAPRPNRGQQAEIEQAVAWTLDSLPAEDRSLPQLAVLLGLLRRGVGYHHAGLLPPLKELVERLFSQGLLSVVCATDTLAIGINMPARTVVISSLARPLGGTLTPNDFSQLTGRAGRRGIDERGAAVMLPGRSYVFEDAYHEVCGRLQPVESAFRLRYSTVLSALEGGGDRLTTLVRSSLRQFQLKARAHEDEEELSRVRARLTGEQYDEDMLEYLLLQKKLSEAEREQRRAKNAVDKNRRSRGLLRRHEEAIRERTQLNRRLRKHARHGEAVAMENRDPERMNELREWARLESRVREALRLSDAEAERTAQAVQQVLSRLDYIAHEGLTRKAAGLREVVAASGIVLTELYERHVFDQLAPDELAEAVSWFASDSRRRRENWYHLPRKLERLRRESYEMYQRIAALEQAQQIELTQGPSETLFGVALAWCRGDSVASIAENVAMGEGDIVGVLNKTVDLLDQFESMLIRYEDEGLIRISQGARRLLVRGLVAMVRSGDDFGSATEVVALRLQPRKASVQRRPVATANSQAGRPRGRRSQRKHSR